MPMLRRQIINRAFFAVMPRAIFVSLYGCRPSAAFYQTFTGMAATGCAYARHLRQKGPPPYKAAAVPRARLGAGFL